jgi:tetratricopeptide (TPR) repeat protein
MPESAKKSLVIFVYAALTLSILLVFWQVRNFDFVNYDDNFYVYDNPHVLDGLTSDGIIWAFTTGYACFWHPVTWLSLMLDCQLFGPEPGGFHLVNVFIHIANTLLLFALLKKMTGSLWPSAFVAAAFALHPMHVESVAWITERKDVLSALFWMLTLLAYVGYVKRPAGFRYLVTIAIFVIGLMTKPMLVTLPFLMLLLDYWPLERFDFQPAKTSDRRPGKLSSIPDRRRILYKIIIEKVPFLILAVVFSIIAFLTQKASGSIVDIKTIPLTDRVGNALLSYATYIGKMFWPQNLTAHYPLNAAGSITLQQCMLYASLLLVISVFVIRFGRRQKYLPLGWFWFVGTLIPVIGLVQFAGSSYADRFTYIPYIGLFIMLAWGMPELAAKWPHRKIALGTAAVIALTAMGIGASTQAGYWRNSITLFSHAIEVTQNNALAHYNLGVAYGDIGRYQDAIETYQQAVRFRPDYAEAYCNLGGACDELGRHQDAVEAFRQAIRIKPDYAKAYYNLGNVYRQLGRHQDAVEAYKQAIRIKPDYAEAYNNLGVACLKLGRYQDTAEACKQAVRIKPDFAEAHYNLGAACHSLGRYQDAIEAYRQAVRIKPDYAKAYCNLGAAYHILGRYQDAIEAYKQAIKIKPDYAEAHYNLGTVYLTTGDKASAFEECKILKTLDAELANKLFNLIK